MSTTGNAPRVSHRGDSGGPQNEHPPPQEANVPTAYTTSATDLFDALEQRDVDWTYTSDQPTARPCTWCQEYGCTTEAHVYWIDADDPLDGPGYVECCLPCLPRRITHALRTCLPATPVTVEIDGGTPA